MASSSLSYVYCSKWCFPLSNVIPYRSITFHISTGSRETSGTRSEAERSRPQYLQTFASCLINSAQNGHFLLSPDSISFCSTFAAFGLATNAATTPIRGLKRTDKTKKPKPVRPFWLAITPAMMEKNIQAIKVPCHFSNSRPR